MERTLSIIKPDATRRSITGKINAMIEDAGLSIIFKNVSCFQKLKQRVYGVHKEAIFRDLVKFITSGPVVVQVLEAENAIPLYRNTMGATNPKEADQGILELNMLNLLRLIQFMVQIVRKAIIEINFSLRKRNSWMNEM